MDIKIETQKQRELDAICISHSRTQKLLSKAKECKNETQLGTTQRLLLRNIDQLIPHVHQYIVDINKCNRVALEIKELLTFLDAEVIATLLLTKILNSISSTSTRTDMAKQLADDLIIQAELTQTYVTEPHKQKTIKDNLIRKQHPNTPMFARRKAHRYKKQVLKSITKSYDMDIKHKLYLGVYLINIVVTKLRLVQLHKKVSYNRKHSAYYITMLPEVRDFLSQDKSVSFLNLISRKLMIVPPLPRQYGIRGGYRVATSSYNDNLIKSRDKSIHKGHLKKIYPIVNKLQEVSLRINKNILDVLRTLFKSNSSLAKLPDQEAGNLRPDIPPNATYIEKAKIKHNLEEYKNTNYGRAIHASRMLAQAEEVKDEPELYTPYQLDFRGRVYACAELNYQGDELSRSLLEFSNATQLTLSGVEALAIYGANVAGHDKASKAFRLQWITDNTKLICACATDPYACTAWQGILGGVEIDKPWLFLAFCFEWLGYILNGLEHRTHIPVSIDASCNAIQHNALMLRDIDTARKVNLRPSTDEEKPHDAYSALLPPIVDQLKYHIEHGTEDNIAVNNNTNEKFTKYGTRNLALRWYNFGIKRSHVKRPVMTLGYGATLRGFGDQIREDIILPERIKSYGSTNKSNYVFTDHGTQDARFLADIIWDASTKELPSVCMLRDLLHEYSYLLYKEGKFVQWTTPLGFIVKQPYYKTKRKSVSVHLQNKKQLISYREETDKPLACKQKSSIAPNFIHSYDATHLMNVVKAHSHKDILTIHDCIAVPPSHIDELHYTVKDELVKLYTENNPLQDFKDEVQAQIPYTKLPDLPSRGVFNPQEIYQSCYCFS